MPVKYELVEAPDNFWAIKILEGPLAGVIYRYGTVSVVNEETLEEDGELLINFEFDVLDPGFEERENIKGPEVDRILGEILSEIITQSVEREVHEHNRKANLEEPDSQ